MRALRDIFEKNAAAHKPLKSPAEFELTRASVAQHNLRFAARRASRVTFQAETSNSERIKRYDTRINATKMLDGQPKAAVESDLIPKSEWMTFGDSDAFWLPELDAAIESNDERGINKAVLNLFFEEHDIQRVKDVDNLLEQYSGREETLFLELSSQYPEPRVREIAEVVGTQKRLEGAQNWAKFDDDDDRPIIRGVRRPTGVWSMNFDPFENT